MNKKLAKIALPLFIFWPFGSFLCALHNLKLKSSAIVIILFSVVFGYSFSFSDSSADSYRTAFVFSVFDFSTFDNVIAIYKQGDSPDIYRLIVYGIAKNFTNNPKVLYALCGLVFGIFMYLSMLMFSKEKENKNDIFVILISLFFFSLNPLSNLNGFRFWTATWVFFYSIINFSIYNNKKWVIGIAATPLIHFSFLFIMPIVIFFYLFKGYLYSKTEISKVVFIVFIITFILSWVLETNSFSLGFLADQDVLNSSISGKVELYNSDRVTQNINERGTSFFHTVETIFGNTIKLYIFIIILRMRKIIMNKPDPLSVKMLAFVMVFISFGFIAKVIPSGGRFQTIAYMAALLLFLRIYAKRPSVSLQKLTLWGVPVFSFSILFGIFFLGVLLTSSTIWYGNLVWLIIEGIGFKVHYSL